MVDAESTNDLAQAVVMSCIALGVVAFVAGALMLAYEWMGELPVRKAAKSASKDLSKAATAVPADSPIKAHGSVGEGVNAIANLAKALKELDRSTRLLVISLAFFAIAAAAAFGDAVGSDEEPKETGLPRPLATVRLTPSL